MRPFKFQALPLLGFEVGSPYCLEKHPCVVGPTMSRFILNLTQVNIVGEAGKRFQGGWWEKHNWPLSSIFWSWTSITSLLNLDPLWGCVVGQMNLNLANFFEKIRLLLPSILSRDSRHRCCSVYGFIHLVGKDPWHRLFLEIQPARASTSFYFSTHKSSTHSKIFDGVMDLVMLAFINGGGGGRFDAPQSLSRWLIVLQEWPRKQAVRDRDSSPVQWLEWLQLHWWLCSVRHPLDCHCCRWGERTRTYCMIRFASRIFHAILCSCSSIT